MICFPDNLKLANVRPCFKSGDRSVMSNYRPISLTSHIAKIFERVVHKYLFNYFRDNGLFYRFQAGFIPGSSTTCQLLEIYHNICRSLDSGEYVKVVFCDASKAFDRVWHDGLLHKLREYGISGDLIQWISSFLKGRKQRVLINNSTSNWLITKAGVR